MMIVLVLVIAETMAMARGIGIWAKLSMVKMFSDQIVLFLGNVCP